MLTLTAAQWATLKAVNQAVNAASAETDLQQYRVDEFWQRIGVTGKGDCEDYALEKRFRLINAGFPPGELRLAILAVPGDGLHCVLTIDTQDGTMVLDNLWPELQSVDDVAQLGYAWIERQATHGFLWVKTGMA